jgi:hypothetical protein
VAGNRAPQRGSATAGADGIAAVTFTPRGSGTVRYTQVSCEMAAPGSGRCTLRFNGGLVCPFPNPASDAVAGYPSVEAGPGDQVQVVWTGVPVGQIGNAVAFWEPVDA